jgi:hypothetical protein
MLVHVPGDSGKLDVPLRNGRIAVVHLVYRRTVDTPRSALLFAARFECTNARQRTIPTKVAGVQIS